MHQQQQTTLIRDKIKKLLPKLKCAFHQTESLTNFCSCPKCLLPLCPTCIKIHTIEHVNMKTDPEYDNLFDVIMNLNMDVKDYLSVYEENHRHLTQVEQRIHQFKDEIFSNIENLKKSLIDEVQKYFTQMLLSTQQEIMKMKYLQDLDRHKSELKKSILALKRFDKLMLDQSVPGKFVIRNLIKYSSKNTNESLELFDSQCKTLFGKIEGNFCSFSLKDNLKHVLHNFLGQVFRINIKPIPCLESKDSQQILMISKRLQEFTAEAKNGEKSEIKNTLTKVMSKMMNEAANTSTTNNSKAINSPQSHLNNTFTYDSNNRKSVITKQQRDNNHNSTQIVRNIFSSSNSNSNNPHNNNSTNKRTFTNHSSQRKSLNISRSFCQNDQQSFMDSDIKLKPSRQVNNYQSSGDNTNKERRSLSKGKGLSLIQPRHSFAQPEGRSLNVTQQIRMSLAEIENNVNFEFDVSKVAYVKRR